jgi:hypothetical protein
MTDLQQAATRPSPHRKEAPMPDPPPARPARGRALACHWPALAGAALATAGPLGVALAAAFPEGITAGQSAFTNTAANGPAVHASGQEAGVRGVAYGQHGVGVRGNSPAPGGTGVAGLGAVGVRGHAAVAPGLEAALDAGVEGTGPTGVRGEGAGPTGVGVEGTGRIGGRFEGIAAPLQLVPASTAGPPAGGTHAVGELYVDSQGKLYLCAAAGIPGTWMQIALTPVK